MRPGSSIKTNTFSFVLIVIGNVSVAQIYWEAVPDTWLGSSKQSFCRQMCYVRGTAHDLLKLTSLTCETKCMSSAKHGGTWPDKMHRGNIPA